MLEMQDVIQLKSDDVVVKCNHTVAKMLASTVSMASSNQPFSIKKLGKKCFRIEWENVMGNEYTVDELPGLLSLFQDTMIKIINECNKYLPKQERIKFQFVEFGIK